MSDETISPWPDRSTTPDDAFGDALAQLAQDAYATHLATLRSHATLPSGTHRTVLASLIVTRPAWGLPDPDHACATAARLPTGDWAHVLSLATGTHAVPHATLRTLYAQQHADDTLHDLHAEVLARRAALRALGHHLLALLAPMPYHDDALPPLFQRPQDAGGTFRLRDGVAFHLYVSRVPCGDAAIPLVRYEVGASEGPFDALPPAKRPRHVAAATTTTTAPTPLAGHDDLACRGRLRLKPARRDAPRSESHSCTDKLAVWARLGMQGAVWGHLFEAPLRIATLVVGALNAPSPSPSPSPSPDHGERRERVRAVREGVQTSLWPSSWRVCITTVPFVGAHGPTANPLPSAAVWTHLPPADRATDAKGRDPSVALLVQGRRQGAGRRRGVFPIATRADLCRPALFALWQRVVARLPDEAPLRRTLAARSYAQVKAAAVAYQVEKRGLLGKGLPGTDTDADQDADVARAPALLAGWRRSTLH